MTAGCDVINPQSEDGRLRASGTITTQSTLVAPEIGGRLAEIFNSKGAMVKQGDLLFKLDDQLQAQYSQAQAAVQAAQSNLELAHQRLAGSQTQLDQVVQAARLQSLAEHTSAWKAAQADKIEMPVWYFEKNEIIAALQSEFSDAQVSLETELSNLDRELLKAAVQPYTRLKFSSPIKAAS